MIQHRKSINLNPSTMIQSDGFCIFIHRCRFIERQTIHFIGMGISRVVVNGENSYATYIPQLGDGPISFFVPLSKWWNQVVMVLDGKHRLTRRNIVLAAANVDKKLTAEYEALAKEGATGHFVYSSDSKVIEIPDINAHMLSLRQMAYEVLNSPELFNYL